jgi:catalase
MYANLIAVRSSFKQMRLGPPDVAHDHWVGKVMSYSSEVTDDDFEQPRALWSIFKKNGEDENFAKNLGGHLCKAKPEVQAATVEMFNKVNSEVGEAIQKVLDEMNEAGTAGIEHDQRRPSGS